jgi:ornithine cyclodeaminase/alanine dehydrogenase-like protein (mu-crystallin family)
MALLINRKEIERLLTLRDAVDAIEVAFKAAGEEPMLNHPRRRLHWRPGDARKLNIFAGSMPDIGYIGALVRFDHANQGDSRRGNTIVHPSVAYEQRLSSESHGRRLIYVLYDAKGLVSIQYGGSIGRGTPIADRTWYGDPALLRTAATSAVGTKYLAKKNSQMLGFLGTGYHAPMHLAAMLVACPTIRIANVYSPNENHRTSFCQEIRKQLNIEVVSVSHTREAVKNADVVVCCTNSVEPVFDGDWIPDGCHVTGIIGQNNHMPQDEWWGAREVDDRFLLRCDALSVNSVEQANQDQQATTWDAVRRRIIDWTKIHELGDLLAGKCPGRVNEKQITFYQNNAGQGIADLALAIKYYDLAKKNGLGAEIEL